MARAKVFLFIVMIFLLCFPVYYLGKAFWVTSNITLYQIVFWSMLTLIPMILWQICKTEKIPFNLNLKIAIPIWVVFFFVYYTTGLFFFSGIADECFINAKVMGGEWEESYTSWSEEEVCDSKDKDGNCTSSHTVKHCDNHHSDSYSISFSDSSDHSIAFNNYKSLVKQFGNEKQVPVFHFDQCSIGDGRKFITTFQNGTSKDLYVSYEIPVVNYILASGNLYNTSSTDSKYSNLFLKVPGIVQHEAGIGPWKSNRVLVSGVEIPVEWRKKTEEELNKLNGSLGPSKEINAIIFVVGNSDRAFSTELESYWVHGKKNQLTIIIGVNKFPVIDWVDVIDFWSIDSNIRINLRDSLQTMTLDKPNLMEVIEKEIVKSWKRKQMKSLDYLAWDLTIPLWAYFLVVVIVSSITVAFTKVFES